jgi:hypothetical protein
MLAPALVVAALVGAVPAQANDPVCNEAENSFRGGYDVAAGDPVPPAFNRGSQMAIGRGEGVEHAAAVSPALAPCEPRGGGGNA